MTVPTYNKGDRIRAQWLDAKLVALAGAQMKVGASGREVTGIVRHIRGDHPTNPTEVRVFIDPDGAWDGPVVKDLVRCTCGHPHVQIKPEWVVEILPPK